MVFTAPVRTHLVSPVHHWCPSAPNHPAQRNSRRDKAGSTPGESSGETVQDNYSMARGNFLNLPLAFWFARDFSSWVCACPRAQGCEQRLLWCASAFNFLFFSKFVASELSPSFSLGHCLGPLDQVFPGAMGRAVGADWLHLDASSTEQSPWWPPWQSSTLTPSLCIPSTSTSIQIHLSSHWIFPLRTSFWFWVFLQQALVKPERLLKMLPTAEGCWASSSGRVWGALLVLDEQIPVLYLK